MSHFFFGLALLLTGGIDAFANNPRRVLLLQSYGNAYSPWSNVAASYRAELSKRSPMPIDFYEISLDIARFQGLPEDPALVEYLHTHFPERKFDLIVTMGQLGARFVGRYRPELFAEIPSVSIVIDQRRAKQAKVGAHDIVIGMEYDYKAYIDHILRIRPLTKEIAVSLGTSPVERSLRSIMEAEYEAFADRVKFTWLNDLSLGEMAQRSAVLPPQSSLFYYVVIQDDQGASYPQDHALDVLRTASSVPIFGIFDFQLGRGIVGGPLIPTGALASNAADASVRVFKGETASDINIPPLDFGPFR
jgi:hypothetical protein